LIKIASPKPMASLFAGDFGRELETVNPG